MLCDGMRAREFPDLLHLFAICVSSSFSLRHKDMPQVSLHSIRSAFFAEADTYYRDLIWAGVPLFRHVFFILFLIL